MRMLVVDHHDSFLWNLVQELGARVGRWPAVLPHSADWDVMRAELAREPELIVLGPGPGRPDCAEDLGLSLQLLREVDPQVPVLGVCFGLQILVYAFGGRLRAAAEVLHGKSREVHHDGRGLFRGLPPRTPMMRYNSWVADTETLPEVLRVRARCTNGEIMALSHVERPLEAVQFHPESIGSGGGAQFLDNVVAWASARRMLRSGRESRGSEWAPECGEDDS